MKNEYPTKRELMLIRKWDTKHLFSLLDFIESIWWNAEWGFKKKWGKDSISGDHHVIYLELHTGGWSGNEDIINSLLKNTMFKMLWYSEWRRGGHFYFEIIPYSIGYKSANQIAKEKGISRQAVHKSINYERIKVSDKCYLFREVCKNT